ncbi:MAG: homocysteine S-methyltransferase family protein [Lachnospiraceae bacterium]|nr:homocysteine S-methyltransferase family protein [Lachnospiraceae bacterium]
MKNDRITILDGGMGTRLQAMGLPLGGIPEVWNITEPEKVSSVHESYLAAGSDVVYTNTFGANSYKMRDSGYTVTELISAGVANARRACAKFPGSRVALDIGPIGKLLSPLGDLAFEDAYELFREQVVAGKDADLIVIETMTDLYEAKAALLAAKENSDKPVFVTMSFEANGRTFTGTSIECMALTLSGLGADAIGFNCSLGPAELTPMVKKLYELTELPIVLKPNAGLPDPVTNQYNVSAEEFADCIGELLPYGLIAAGGCCGTTPEYIAALKAKAVAFAEEEKRTDLPEKRKVTGICSSTDAVWFSEPRVIGERINPTGKKRFKEALLNGDMDYILSQAISQVDAGADILDVNVGLPGVDEKEMMVRVIRELQAIVSVPLQIDSKMPEVIEAALRIYNGRALVNSVDGEEKNLSSILPIVKKYGAAVVGLTLDEGGIPTKAEGRFAIAERIVKRAEALGIKRNDVQIDCLTLTASAEQAAVAETLKALAMVHDRLHTGAVLGVSNISFGLPNRELVNSTFLTMALQNGLTLPIMNPNSESMMGALRAYRLLMNLDQHAMAYTEAYKDFVPAKADVKPGATTPAGSVADETEAKIRSELGDKAAELYAAVLTGRAERGELLAGELLEEGDPMTMVNGVLIPALDTVGAGFEKGRIFLPQLMLSASVVQGVFGRVKEHMGKTGQEQVSKGTIVLATVKGDIHDIGKNIVKMLLENYGFTVRDLGRDVDPQVVVQAAKETGAPLVGLSALMTTTLGSMEETIRALKEAGLNCKTVVGGAVLTPDYAERIGADYYGSDAKATVDIAREVFHC